MWYDPWYQIGPRGGSGEVSVPNWPDDADIDTATARLAIPRRAL